MSTRSSILYLDDGAVHLFADVLENYAESGLHLDLNPVPTSAATGQYGDLELVVLGDGRLGLSLRIPVEVCEAIADYVLRRRERGP